MYQQLQGELHQRQQAEEELERQQQLLVQSNAALEQFAAIASHDLQEPLRKIQVFGNQLQEQFSELLGARGRDYIERMQNAVGRMQRLIDDLLTFARINTRAQPFVATNLLQVVQEVLSDLEVRVQQTQGRVEVEELPTIDADPVQMRQLFQNLIGNALKFHRPQVPPVVKVGSQPLNARLEAVADNSASVAAHQIVVADNGIGFEPKYQERIFQAFQRLHGRTQYEGTGIGLAICRKIVLRHGGSIKAASQPGQGTQFIITLPLHQQYPLDEKLL